MLQQLIEIIITANGDIFENFKRHYVEQEYYDQQK